jgi:quercetin dioxygenase-like cupin family protein
MHYPRLLLPLVLALAGANTAYALEPSGQVKVTPVLKTQSSWDGKRLAYPAGEAEVTVVEVELAPGGETGWHMHPVPSVGMLLEGQIEVNFRDGESKQLRTGEAAAEVVNVYHNGRNTGDVPARMIIFYAGEHGTPLTVPEASTAP